MIKSDIQYSNKLHLFFALVIVATTFTKLRGSEEHFLIPFIHSSIGPMEIIGVLVLVRIVNGQIIRARFGADSVYDCLNYI